MPVKLIPPGTRHGNAFYYAIVSVPGYRTEISTRTNDKKLAERFARRVEAEAYERFSLGTAGAGTVGQAIDNYISFRRPRKLDENYLLAIKGQIGNMKLSDVSQVHFDATAQVLYAGRTNETWNRSVYTPLQAALRHAGRIIALRRPKQRKPRHKSLTAIERDKLIDAATDVETKGILILMFYTGCRISEAIKLTWDRVDLAGEKVCFDASKTDEDSWRPLHPKVVLGLANLPGEKHGKVFRWQTRFGARKAIGIASTAAGMKFHPHMARHTFGDLMQEAGASLRDMMDAGGWKSEKAAMRYTTRRVERARKVVGRL